MVIFWQKRSNAKTRQRPFLFVGVCWTTIYQIPTTHKSPIFRQMLLPDSILYFHLATRNAPKQRRNTFAKQAILFVAGIRMSRLMEKNWQPRATQAKKTVPVYSPCSENPCSIVRVSPVILICNTNIHESSLVVASRFSKTTLTHAKQTIR